MLGLPSWLLWLLPVPAATLAAVAWNAWAGRARGPGEATESVAAYERFRSALASPPPGAPAPRRDDDGTTTAGDARRADRGPAG